MDPFFANLQTQLRPLIIVKKIFLLNIFEQIDGIWSNFAYALTLTDLGGIVMHPFLQIYNTVMDLCCCQNFISAQYMYLVNKSMEFDQILHMHWS